MNYRFLFTLANFFKKETICDYLIKKKKQPNSFFQMHIKINTRWYQKKCLFMNLLKSITCYDHAYHTQVSTSRHIT